MIAIFLELKKIFIFIKFGNIEFFMRKCYLDDYTYCLI